ncbi:porin family protein [Gracilimonas amylolytica]|uniref:porin family protein n=1 Tax=Gracilimonas amylolytica TaxID=1749045 RepID=UPI000CD8AEDE|nr:porin family protein [Gracilimonas amylolytica]
MKNKITILSLVTGIILLFSATAQAQVLPKFGVKAGLNYSTFNNADGVEYKAGFLGGVYANINIPGSPAAIQPELLYAQYGANAEGTDGKLSVDYIQIPVLAKFGFGAPGVNIKPEVFFGPYAGFTINSELEDAGFAVDADEVFKNSDFGVVVGAGLQVSKLNFELRYTAGLTDVFEDAYADGEKNGAFALAVGINF